MAVYSALLGTYLIVFKPVNAVPLGIVCWGAAWLIWRVGRKVAETKKPTFYV